MLALNVQTEFIDAFFDLSSSFERSEKKMESEKHQKTISIEKAFLKDTVIHKDNYLKTIQASEIADQSVKYIDSLISILINKTGGFNEFGFPINSISPKISTTFFMESSAASDLKLLLRDTQNKLTPLIGDEYSTLVTDIYEVKDLVVNSNGDKLSWEEYHFNRLALGGVIAILSRFKNDIRMMESNIINYHINQIYGDISTLIITEPNNKSKVTIKVENQKTFTLGDTIIFISHSPKSVKSKKSIIKLDDFGNIISKLEFISEEEITFIANETGKFMFKNEYLLEGNSEPYEISKNFNIIEPYDKTNEIIVVDELIKTKFKDIIYLGINNIIKLDYPNIPKSQLNISVNNGIVKKINGKHILVAEKKGFVVIELLHNNNKLAQKTFTVKELPDPRASISQSLNSSLSSKIFRIQSSLNLSVEEDEFLNAYQIERFNFSKINSVGQLSFTQANNTAFFSKSILSEVRSAKSGEIYIFNDIIVKSDDGRTREISPLIINIK